MTSAADLTAQLQATWASLSELCAGLDAGEWLRPTGCPGWTVHDVVAHVMGTEALLLGRPAPQVDLGEPAHVHNDVARLNEAWVVGWRGRSDAELLDELRTVTAERLAALRAMDDDDFAKPSWTPVGQATYGRFMQIRIFDCWVHEQDIRAATGRPGGASGPAAEQSIDEIERSLGFVVGKRVGAPDGTRLTIELTGPVVRSIHVAVDGRAKVVDRLDRPADAVFTTDSTTFAALACGRIDPAAAAGRVTLAGDAELGARLRGGLAFTI